MRRLQLVIAIILLAVAHGIAHAQGAVGIKGGLSYGTASNSGLAPGATTRSGLAIGVGVLSGGPVGLGMEVLYAQRGFTSERIVDSRRLDYIDVPVYFRLAMPGESITPFVYVGPQVSYEMKCGTGSGECPDVDRGHFSYAGVIGAGARLGMAAGLSLEARYIYGLSNLKLSTVTTTESYKTRSLLLLLGLGF